MRFSPRGNKATDAANVEMSLVGWLICTLWPRTYVFGHWHPL